MTYLNPRIKINSLFGSYSIARNNIEATFDKVGDEFEPLTKDFILRESGLGTEIDTIQKGLRALRDPETYLKEKNEDLFAISEEIQKIFRESYIKNLNRGLTQKEAKEEALQWAIDHKKKLYSEHMLRFPTKLKEPILAKKDI